MQSPEKDIKLDLICRCCLTEEGSMKNMQSETFESDKKLKIRLLDGFTECSGVTLFTEPDESTKNICQQCENKLRSSYDFRELCQSSDEVLRQKLDFIVDVKEEFDSETEENDKNIVYEDNQPNKFSQVFVAQKDKLKVLKPSVTIKTEERKNDYVAMDCSDEVCAEHDTSSEDERKAVTPKRKGSRNSVETTKTLTPQLDCKGCNLKFSTDFSLKRHIKQKKHSQDLFHCPNCGLGCKLFSQLLEHFNLHKGEFGTIVKTFYPCFHCKNIFFRQANLKNHDCSVFVPASLHGLNVEQIRRIKRDKARAAKKLKSEKPQQELAIEKNFICDRCAIAFISADELLCHQLSLCSKGHEHVCAVCQKEFRTKSHLFSHNLNFHKEKTFICDQCGGKYATAPKLEKHLITHRTERTFKCVICLLGFKDAYGLEVHSRSHEERKLECYLCKKKYRSLGTIRLHMGIHIQALKTFDCEFCEKKFSRAIDKQRHLAAHTGDHVKCPYCSKEYQTGAGMRMHIKKVHEGLRYDCYICNQPMSTREQLYKHLFLHRGFKPYNCPLCARAFVRKYRLKTHLKSHNVKYDEKIHGYTEKDENIYKMIDNCASKSGKKPATTSGLSMVDYQGHAQTFSGENETFPSEVVISNDYGSVF